jgi:hypothetical protein
MNSESYYTEYWQEFVQYTNDLDKIRHESISTVVPSLNKYLEKKDTTND